MGTLNIYLDRFINGLSLKIKVTSPGATTLTNAFSIYTVCGSNSTTITNSSDLETSQQYQIHTGNYWNAPSSNGYKPNVWISPYQVSQSLCGISTYELINSQVDQTAPSMLSLTSASLSSTKYVWVADSANFTRASYTFTIKVTASGGAITYTDFSFNVVYDC